MPYLVIGGSVGVACHVALFIRRRSLTKMSSQVNVKSDRFGVKVSMLNAPLEHDPDRLDLQYGVVNLHRLPKGISPLEIDALRLLAAYPSVPADVDGIHGSTLAEHSFNAWKVACERHQAGSLQAKLALLHDLGKLRAYSQSDKSIWIRQGMHRAAALQVVRDFPSFISMPPKERGQLMMLMTALLTNYIPVDMSEEDRAVLRSARHADFKATDAEKHAQPMNSDGVNEEVNSDEPEEAVTLDAEGVYELLKDSVAIILGEMNINRAVDANATLEGFYLPELKALLLPEQWLRHHIAKSLPQEITTRLDLTQKGTKGKHPARELIVDVAYLLFETFDVFGDKEPTDGTFNIQTAIRVVEDVIAIKADQLPDALKTKWGKWNYEIDVL